MHHLMFDVDGTLVESYKFDEQCFLEAVKEVTGLTINSQWADYPHVTDRGILKTVIKTHRLNLDINELEQRIKPIFVQKIRQHLTDEPVQETRGALRFFTEVKADPNYELSIATGGWGETAVAKLESAGFNLDGVAFASSNDHHCRKEIMAIAQDKSGQARQPLTYFGDAQWDVRACSELAVNLVIVGTRTSHHQQIESFTDRERALNFVNRTVI